MVASETDIQKPTQGDEKVSLHLVIILQSRLLWVKQLPLILVSKFSQSRKGKRNRAMP